MPPTAALVVEHELAVAQRLGVGVDDLGRPVDGADREQLDTDDLQQGDRDGAPIRPGAAYRVLRGDLGF